MARIDDSTVIERLMAKPHLPVIVKELHAHLEQETQRRRAFYEDFPDEKKAEFINGEIVIQPPARLAEARAGGNLFIMLKMYVEAHERGWVGYEEIMVSLNRNDYEPDICYFGRDKADAFTPDQMHFPAPDLVVEILSPSTASRDRGVKFEDYAAHGVAEYWLIDPETETVEQYRLAGETYELVMKSRTGDLESAAVAGFAIPIRAIFEPPTHRATLRRLLDS